MKKEYYNPTTTVVLATVATILMASGDDPDPGNFHDLVGGGTIGAPSVPGRKVYI